MILIGAERIAAGWINSDVVVGCVVFETLLDEILFDEILVGEVLLAGLAPTCTT